MSDAPVKVEQTDRPLRRGGFALPRLARFIVAGYPRAVGATFLLAASLKVWDESGIARVLEFDRLPERLIQPAISLLIAVETAVGLMLILRPKLAWVLDASIALLAIYTLQLAYLAASRDAPGCACLAAWEAFHSARLGNLLGIGRNICLMLPLLWVRAQVTRPRPRPLTHTSGTSAASS